MDKIHLYVEEGRSLATELNSKKLWFWRANLFEFWDTQRLGVVLSGSGVNFSILLQSTNVIKQKTDMDQ